MPNNFTGTIFKDFSNTQYFATKIVTTPINTTILRLKEETYWSPTPFFRETAMVELAPQTKFGEERPLLKVEGGSGDGSGRQLPTVVSPPWSVTCSTKRSWLDRWPEFLTACWMTGILLAISFLMMYVLTIGSMKRNPVLIVRCNESKPSSEVYYHHIVSMWKSESFMLYSDYLAEMAEQYPFLHFNVIFMLDDSFQTTGRRHNKNYAKLMSLRPPRDPIRTIFENIAIREFEHKYQNVNITIIHLSKFMARTPLKYKWRSIPQSYLPFYARVYSVWQTGGIGMDLGKFGDKFNNHQAPDTRITTILKHHNDGINTEDYRRALDIIERNEENEFVSSICSMINNLFSQMFQETTTFFNSSFWFPTIGMPTGLKNNDTLVRTHRNKREATEQIINKNNSNNSSNKEITNKLATVNTIAVTTQKDRKTADSSVPSTTTIKNTKINVLKPTSGVLKKVNESKKLDKKENNSVDNELEIGTIDEGDYDVEPNVYMTYQISLMSDDPDLLFIGPQKLDEIDRLINGRKQPGHESTVKPEKRSQSVQHFLTLEADGSFVASTSLMHPLLGHLMSVDCKRFPPKYSIKNAFLNQCSGSYKDDVYCDNIYLI